ncbi:DUF4231 domain-containing protein [Kitasatospora saccharophila]|uniref:DUF4231 domain-containing protein n=1 Tax=Kitasatospora saccharophila TaxID=407973 RepID=UPI0031DD8D1A
MEIEQKLRAATRTRLRCLAIKAIFPSAVLILFLVNIVFWGKISLWRIDVAGIPISFALFILRADLPAEGNKISPWGQKYIAEQRLELELAHERRRLMAVKLNLDPLSRRYIYRETVPVAIDRYQRSGARYRAVHNGFQSVIIVGSLATSTIAALGDSVPRGQLLTVAASFAVGVSAGFTGYFKYRERSFYLQQTSDSLAEELNSVNLKIGRYRAIESEEEAIAEFTERAEILQNEQRRRQQQLDQPAQASLGD